MAYKKFLISNNHHVDVITIPNKQYINQILFYYQKIISRLYGREKRLINKIADKIEKIIKKKNYEVIIGVETNYSHVLTKKLDCFKIFSYEAPQADELYFSKKRVDIERVKNYRKIELDIMIKSDYVIFPWKTTENYVRKYIRNGKNFITIKYGCYPKNKTVKYFFPPSIISLGNIKYYWANKKLISYLTKISPYIIDVYGKHKPERKHRINYKGFARSLDVFYNYQFGLNTISKDILRQNHFSSRIISYLAYGLPVLFPEWQKFPKELKGCIPYNEENFSEIIEKYSERDQWEKLSEEATRQGRELDWNITLKPLEKLIEK